MTLEPAWDHRAGLHRIPSIDCIFFIAVLKILQRSPTLFRQLQALGPTMDPAPLLPHSHPAAARTPISTADE